MKQHNFQKLLDNYPTHGFTFTTKISNHDFKISVNNYTICTEFDKFVQTLITLYNVTCLHRSNFNTKCPHFSPKIFKIKALLFKIALHGCTVTLETEIFKALGS